MFDRTPYYSAVIQASATMAALIGAFLVNYGLTHGAEYRSLSKEIEDVRDRGLKLINEMPTREEMYEDFRNELDRLFESSGEHLLENADENMKSPERTKELAQEVFQSLAGGPFKWWLAESAQLSEGVGATLRAQDDLRSRSQLLSLAVGIVALLVVAGMLAPMGVLYIGPEVILDDIENGLFLLTVVSLGVSVWLIWRVARSDLVLRRKGDPWMERATVIKDEPNGQ